MGEPQIKITSEIDYDDLSLYGIDVQVDMETGDTYILRGETVLLSITHNPKTKEVEVKKRSNGELKVVLNGLIAKMDKYSEKLKQEGYKIEELDGFFYEFICNSGFKKDKNELYEYDAEIRKIFWQFFNQYVKLRFMGDYKKDINIPELIEIESTIIDWDIEVETSDDTRKEMEHAQFFCYTRQKNRRKIK